MLKKDLVKKAVTLGVAVTMILTQATSAFAATYTMTAPQVSTSTSATGTTYRVDANVRASDKSTYLHSRLFYKYTQRGGSVQVSEAQKVTSPSPYNVVYNKLTFFNAAGSHTDYTQFWHVGKYMTSKNGTQYMIGTKYINY